MIDLKWFEENFSGCSTFQFITRYDVEHVEHIDDFVKLPFCFSSYFSNYVLAYNYICKFLKSFHSLFVFDYWIENSCCILLLIYKEV